MASAQCRSRIAPPALSLEVRLEQNPKPSAAHPPAKFDAAFIERRMREHHDWQERTAAAQAAEIVSEVVSRVEQFYDSHPHRRMAANTPRMK